jgi:hypothetical protein
MSCAIELLPQHWLEPIHSTAHLMADVGWFRNDDADADADARRCPCRANALHLIEFVTVMCTSLVSESRCGVIPPY